MKLLFGFSVLASLVVLVSSGVTHAEHTRATYPDAMNIEILGRGMLWSATYDRVVSDELAAGFGFGAVGTKPIAGRTTSSAASEVVSMVPVYMNYYFMQDAGSVYATGGANVLLNNVDTRKSKLSNLEFNDTQVVPTFGVGYENRTEAGFLVRATVYGLASENVTAWFGFTFGYAF